MRLAVKENRKLTPDEVAEVVARYQAGASIRSLGKTFRMHEQTVRAHLRRQGVTLRSVRALTKSQGDEAVRLYVDEQWTLAEIGRKLNVDHSTIRSLLVRRGVRRRAAARRES